MQPELYTGVADAAGYGFFFVVLALAMIWSLVWKGIALWHAARNGHKIWYVIMLIVNTVGILEIIYIFAVAKVGSKHEDKPAAPTTPIQQ
ncbi:MAG: DUF5652 family protein [Parcubacteria group bacterium]